MSRCQCLTKSGKQCSRKAKEGEQFCFQHDKGKCKSPKKSPTFPKLKKKSPEKMAIHPRMSITAMLHNIKKTKVPKDIKTLLGKTIREMIGRAHV